VPSRETFGSVCQRVCEQEGWELLPSGVRVSLPDGRYQLVGLEFFEEERQELVRLYTTIGDSRGLSPLQLETALRLNFSLARGGFALHDDELVMVDQLLLHDAGPEEIRTTIAYLAETADRYEKSMFGTDEH
jgi:hypothetical protein